MDDVEHNKKPLCSWLNVRKPIENIFKRLGFLIARKPWMTICLSLLVFAISAFGIFKFKQEKDPLKLWIDQDSQFVHDTHWLLDSFAEGYRQQNVLITADNVLDPFVLEQLALINHKIINITTKNEKGAEVLWNGTCFKVPIVPIKLHLQQQTAITLLQSNNSTKNAKDFTSLLPLGLYCAIVNNLKEGCLQYNLVDIWKYDLNTIKSLTIDNVLANLNSTFQSPTLGHPINYINFLGGVEKNSSGYVISAKAILSTWFLRVNFSEVNSAKTGNDAGTENLATNENLIWEKRFLNLMEEVAPQSKNMTIFYEAGRSYGDISSGAMFADIDKLMIGIVLMCIYIHIVISKWNCVSQRFVLGGMSMFSIGMSFLMTVSLCSLFGLSYGPVHTSLPFLLMGLGIDDMFVLLACWERVSVKAGSASLPKRIGIMLKEAGMAVTVTTFTDMAAFFVGSFTVLPSLHSFCLYAAVGVFVIYLFTITFVVACFTLDQRRIENNFNGFIPCIKHIDYTPNQCSTSNYLENYLSLFYSKLILTKFGKIVVTLLTILLAAISIKNSLLLEQKFDPFWFIPENSHLYKYVEQRKMYFPQIGFEAAFYTGRLNYTEDFKKILRLEQKLQTQDIINNIDSWVIPFYEYVEINFNIDLNETVLSYDIWKLYLSRYLHSPSGGKHRDKFKFSDVLICGKSTPDIKVSIIKFNLKRFSDTRKSIDAMNQLRKLVNEVNFLTGDKFCTVWSKMFGTWSTDEIIGQEVQRNLLLALGCVMICTLIFISSFSICWWIFLCVLLTLVNVSGWMYIWGLTIDLVSCIALQLSVGLCIDYATHIGHIFLSVRGNDKTERSLNVMRHIGGAVLYGGGSTLLALSTLAFSQAYIFKAFFKIFFLIIIFGLYHGMIFLPVMLSLMGPNYKKKPKENRRPGGDIMLKEQEQMEEEVLH